MSTPRKPEPLRSSPRPSGQRPQRPQHGQRGQQPRRPAPPRRAPRRNGRSRGKSVTAIAAVITGASLAIGAGVALDRVLLPELRSDTASANGAAPRPATDRTAGVPSPGAGDVPGTAAGTSPRNVPVVGSNGLGVTTPPLKPLRGAAVKPSTSPTPSPSSSPGDGPSGAPPAPGASGPETVVATLTNKERAKAGCGALRIDQRLVTSARRHSADMAAHDYFDHTSRNGDSPWKRMEDAGYPSPGAENIAKGYPTASAVVAGWMKSPGHRANILNCKLRAIGVGIATGSGGPWWTQNFGWK